MKLERRVLPLENIGIETRTDDSGNEITVITGYAAVFNKNSLDLGGFVESIRRGAFKESLGQDDVRALKNHNPNALLGRTAAGTLRLKEDREGLRMEIDVPNTTTGRDTVEEIRRGDLTGASFSFDTIDDKWESKGEVPHRTLIKARLYDVGPAAFPAYPDTSLGLRSLEAWQQTNETAEREARDLADVNARLDIALKNRINADAVRETEGV